MRRRDRIVAQARALVGVPFRLHGRSAEYGLDCVGVVALAYAAAGHKGVIPVHYALRGGDAARFAEGMRQAGLRRVRVQKPGDVLLVQAGPAQFHLLLLVPGGFVHAHAGLRKVTQTPGDSPWPVLGAWRWGR